MRIADIILDRMKGRKRPAGTEYRTIYMGRKEFQTLKAESDEFDLLSYNSFGELNSFKGLKIYEVNEYSHLFLPFYIAGENE